MDKAKDEMKRIGDSLSVMVLKTEQVVKNQQQIETSINVISQKQEDIQDSVGKLEINQNVLAETSDKLATKLETINIERNVMEETLMSRMDNLNDRVSRIEHYHSLRRPSKIFFNIPDRVKYFVGRDCELRQLEEHFRAYEMSFYAQVISGLGGSGKTTLAIEYSWLMQNYYKGGVFWLSAENSTELENSMTRLALDAKTMGKNSNETLLLTLNWLGKLTSNWLLVVDNVDEEDLSNEMKELL